MDEEAAAQAAQIATEMARLKSRRGGLKIAAANMKTRANTLMTADEVDLAALSAAEMQIKDKFEKILLLDEQILDLMITDDEIADEISSADTHNYEIQVVLQSIGLIKNKKSSGKNSEGNTKGSNQKRGIGARLPKIVLENFSGDSQKYFGFMETFLATVDSQDLDDASKLTYLKGLLKGEALRSIEGLSIGGDNYRNALQILESRFGTKDKIISSVMDTLVSLPPVRGNDLKGIRRLHDSLEIGIRNLENMGIPSDSYGTLLVPILKKKLPSELNLILNRSFMSKDDSEGIKIDPWNIKDLQNCLKFEIEAREGSSSNKDLDDKNKNERRDFRSMDAL